MGNHDHFHIGSFPVDANPALGIRQSYIADSVWSIANILVPNLLYFRFANPALSHKASIFRAFRKSSRTYLTALR